jgi:dolichol-phosphate mannosyltransferase
MTTPAYSIVVPMMNEAGNVLPLANAVADAMRAHDYELVLVDDASTDTTLPEMEQAKASNPRIRIIRHAKNRGQSRGLLTGIRAARAPWIITLDGDMQNPPSEITKLIDAKPEGYEAAVCGIRATRQDNESRRWASKWANTIRRAWLRDDCPDTGCSLKMYPREAFLRLPYFDHIHRYLPPLFKQHGLSLVYINVAHQPRTVGVSKYTNWQRALVGITDLLGVRWLMLRTNPVKSWEE